MRVFLLFLFGAAFVFPALASGSAPIDSVKVIRAKDKKYIIHKVEKGEGFLSLSRRYNVSVDDIKASNDDLKSLQLGQKIRIPMQDVAVKNDPPKRNPVDSSKIKVDESHANADAKEPAAPGGTPSPYKIHIVQPGETIYKIAARYKITTQQLINWNGIVNNKIDVGQELAVSGISATLSYEKWNTTNSMTSKSVSAKNILSPDTAQIEESGLAVVSSENIHPMLQPGTIVLIMNPENNRQCIIRIEGKRSAGSEAVIGLEQEVLTRLGITDVPSRVTLKYNQ
jgi:LysM repeat protein